VAGKVDVLDELQIISCKRLTTVRRYGWLCLVLGSPHVLKSAYRPSALLSRHNISITIAPKKRQHHNIAPQKRQHHNIGT
jgi:hypothetical protein